MLALGAVVLLVVLGVVAYFRTARIVIDEDVIVFPVFVWNAKRVARRDVKGIALREIPVGRTRQQVAVFYGEPGRRMTRMPGAT